MSQKGLAGGHCAFLLLRHLNNLGKDQVELFSSSLALIAQHWYCPGKGSAAIKVVAEAEHQVNKPADLSLPGDAVSRGALGPCLDNLRRAFLVEFGAALREKLPAVCRHSAKKLQVRGFGERRVLLRTHPPRSVSIANGGLHFATCDRHGSALHDPQLRLFRCFDGEGAHRSKED